MEIAGKKVIDAKSRLRLKITPLDIKKGNNKDPGGCAAALALCKMPKIKAARVHLSTTYLDMGDHWLRFETPPRLRTEIVAFDRGGVFAPADYELLPPRKSGRLFARNKRAERNKRESPRMRGTHRKSWHATSDVRHRLVR